MKRVLAVGILGVAVVITGCGGGGISGSCANGKACGGNVVGSWHITSSCLSVDVTSMDDPTFCPGETSMASGFAITGDGTYGADLTYAETSTLTGNVVVHLPPSCLMSQGITVTCEQVMDALLADPSSSDYSSIACVTDAGCTCTVGLKPQTTTVTGTYTTTAAGVLTEMDDGSTTADTGEYCVSGDTLTLSPQAGSGMLGQGELSGTVTLTRK